MFKTYTCYLIAEKHMIELQELQKRQSGLSDDDQQELDALMDACLKYRETMAKDIQAAFNEK